MNNSFKVFSPIDNSLYVERPYATSSEIQKCLDKSVFQQKEWAKTPIEERASICHRFLKYFQIHLDEISQELTWQMGRPIRFSPFEISKGFFERAKYMIDIAPTALKEYTPPGKQDGLQRFVRRDPIGTVLALAPWNYPYLTSVNVVIPAIMAGNCVILKHAIQTPLCAERYNAAFEYANLPNGVFQYLHMTHQQVADVIKSPQIDYVSFTGSVQGGIEVSKSAKEQFFNIGLELGGKDPAYVCDDVDLNIAVENLVDGAFFNSGQSCCGIERIYVHALVYDDFINAFQELTHQYILGDPTDDKTTLGPMVKKEAAYFVMKQIYEAEKKGAKKLIDISTFAKHNPKTPYIAPQVLVGVNHNMEVMQEESFGPLVGIMKVKNDEEAIQLMNDSKFGLTASVWTQDSERALRIGNKIETGTFFMNRCDYLDPALAWTGVKNSGSGCSLSKFGFDSLTRLKSFHLKL